MDKDDWCELTENFHPQEHMEHLIKLLGKFRVFATNDDRLYLFTDSKLTPKHVAYRIGARWICPCPDRLCAAAAVMRVASFAWIIDPEAAVPNDRED